MPCLRDIFHLICNIFANISLNFHSMKNFGNTTLVKSRYCIALVRHYQFLTQ